MNVKKIKKKKNEVESKAWSQSINCLEHHFCAPFRRRRYVLKWVKSSASKSIAF